MADTMSNTANTGTIYLVAIQVTSRLLTFIGNQFLLRYVSPSLLGLAVQLELLSVAILYSSRESLRVALQREPVSDTAISKTSSPQDAKKSSALQLQEAVNMSYLVILIGILIALIFGLGYLRKSDAELLRSEDFWLAFYLYVAATLLELIGEPYFVVIQKQSLYKTRAKAETMAAVCKCLGACSVAFGMYKYKDTVTIRPFAIGQAFYAIILLWHQRAVISNAHAAGVTLLPRKISKPTGAAATSQYWFGYFSKSLSTLTFTFYAQSVFKLLLTEGDRWILSFVADLHSQGSFALASNYGGLLSRLLFQPVEESSRNVFGRLLATTATSNADQFDGSTQTRKPKNKSSQNQADKNIDQALNHLSNSLHLYTLFALPLLVLLPHLFPILVSNIVGARWSSQETTKLLSAYAYYLPFLAVNGILDAFVTSAASPRQLRHQSFIMVFVTLVYGTAAWVFMASPEQDPSSGSSRSLLNLSYLAMGSVGLVWANIVNMTLRIGYSIWFISRWINGNSSGRQRSQRMWRDSLPHIVCTVTALAVAVGLSMTLDAGQATSQKRFLGVKGLDVTDVGSYAAASLVLGSSILFFEYHFLSTNLMTLVPERLATKIAPYLPGSKQKS